MDRLASAVDGDTVNEVLASLRVQSTVYCSSQMRSPWGFAVPERDASAFHLVLRGAGWLEVDGVDAPVRLEAGDLVLLMTGRGHRVRDDPSSPVEWLDDILARTPVEHGRLRHGGSGDLTELICGGFDVVGAPVDPLLLAVPPVLRTPGTDAENADLLDAFLAVLRDEIAAARPGSPAVLARLADVLITRTIRNHLVSLADADRRQLGALQDPRIAKAIRLAHADPAHLWTVEELAAEVAMSRSAFAAAFRQLTGESPMRYVTRCRLALAASLLVEDGATVSEIAHRTGYDSEASLTKAFSRALGVAPGAYRRRLHRP